MGLDDIGDKYPFELSGGMRQRAAIARALAIGSPLLLMDEPFGALDPVNRARLQDVLLDVWETAEPKTTVLFVTHDVDEALYLGQRVVILGSSPGRVIADLNVPFPATATAAPCSPAPNSSCCANRLPKPWRTTPCASLRRHSWAFILKMPLVVSRQTGNARKACA